MLVVEQSVQLSRCYWKGKVSVIMIIFWFLLQIGNAMRCPATKFITHTLSHLSFLILLAAATFRLEDKAYKVLPHPDRNITLAKKNQYGYIKVLWVHYILWYIKFVYLSISYNLHLHLTKLCHLLIVPCVLWTNNTNSNNYKNSLFHRKWF